MFKFSKIQTAGMILAAVSAISLMTGCGTVTVPVSVTVPGEFRIYP